MVYGQEVDLKYKPEELKPLYRRAFAILGRHRLHTEGVTYAMQGFALDETGVLPAWLLSEHATLSLLYTRAHNRAAEKQRRAAEAASQK